MSIINDFEKYFLYPSDDHAYTLWQSIMEFEDFQNLSNIMSDINDLPRNMIGNTRVLQTNGSTSIEPTSYKFSNEIWIGIVENHLRGNKFIKIEDRLFTQKPYIEILPNDMHRLNMNNINHLKDILKPWNQNRILAKGHSWLAASTNPEICDLLELHNVEAINTDSDLCFHNRLHIPMFDQMIDWSTGINFWTCKKGHKHVLPIFHIKDNMSKNLLNVMATDKRMDDLFIQKDTIHCECGKKRLDFEFQSHHKNNISIDRNIINELNCCYKYLQFIQVPHDDSLNVFYSSISPNIEDDLHKLKKLLENNYHCKFVKDKFAYVGRGTRGGKFYTFWKGNCLIANYYSLEDIESKARIWTL